MIIDVKNCARCGENHDRLDFRGFTRAHPTYSAWATCPETGEPIFIHDGDADSPEDGNSDAA